MNDEIKEILDDLKSKEYDDISLIICEVISRKKIKCILDYITNLQKENEILKELNICVGCENNPDYKLRCEKAINFINKTKGFIFNEYEEIITGEVVDADGVLDILEGENNE